MTFFLPPLSQFHLHDDNVLAVATYAIAHLGVEHVVIVGHTQCGGAAATYTAAQKKDLAVPSAGPDAAINKWLGPLVNIAGQVEASGVEGKYSPPDMRRLG